jgi:hypothetical protein
MSAVLFTTQHKTVAVVVVHNVLVTTFINCHQLAAGRD